MILDTIVAHKQEEIKIQKSQLPLSELRQTLRDISPTRDFKAAISRPGKINLIAEVKKASPSKGIIREDFDPIAIAQIYQSSGASAISVLTDERFFQGSLAYLTAIRETTSIPLLRKDFIIDEYQIYQARAAGADAILLIAAILEIETMQTFLNIAHSLHLDCLVEVHTESELRKVLDTDAQIIGINNRDLRTFQTNIDTTIQLRKLIPQDKVVVSESGIHSRQDVKMLQECGVNAILVGEALMRSADINAKVKELMEG
ncbi:indole-3-glycerol phosphate synthase TrpC [Candidatus Poribacteria bacterium]|nr:indole-3-glycerol phosphate synthase TrpC [Candidatus Poribacteria bacterium]